MQIFAAVAEPNRREILDLLRDGEQPAGAIVDTIGLSQPTVSQHLKVLREAGLVTVRADANRRLYRLQPAALLEIDAWLEPFRQLWSNRLDALERHLDSQADDRGAHNLDQHNLDPTDTTRHTKDQP
ncbi:MAG: metalloregulator ArsR/SmtB family transcription factor [Acidimicrobiales bacterium]